MADFDIADGLRASLYALDEVGPQLGDIVCTARVHFWFDVDWLGLFVPACGLGVKYKSVVPADEGGALAAVETGADIIFFDWMAGVLSVLPGAGERFEFIDDDLRIGSVADVVFYEFAAIRIDGFGVLFVGPPEYLVEPVNSPVAKLAVGVIEKLSETAGMYASVIGTQRGRAAPEVPVKPFGRLGIRRAPVAIGVIVCKRPHQTDFAGLAFFEKLIGLDVVMRDAPVRIDLHDAAVVAGGFDQGPAFVDGMADGLFVIYVGAGVAGGDGNEGVPVVGRRIDYNLRFFPAEQLAIVFVFFRCIAGELLDFGGGLVEDVTVNVAECDDFTFAGFDGLAGDVHTPPARADKGGAVFAGPVFCNNVRHGKGHTGDG